MWVVFFCIKVFQLFNCDLVQLLVIYRESGEMCAMKEVTLFSDDAKSRESAQQLGQVSLLVYIKYNTYDPFYIFTCRLLFFRKVQIMSHLKSKKNLCFPKLSLFFLLNNKKTRDDFEIDD